MNEGFWRQARTCRSCQERHHACLGFWGDRANLPMDLRQLFTVWSMLMVSFGFLTEVPRHGFDQLGVFHKG